MATDVKEGAQPGNRILVGVPSKNGLCSHNFRLHMDNIQKPMNTNLVHLNPRYKPVDVARNAIVSEALKHNIPYILFVDDDVLVPPHIIARFMHMVKNNDVKVVTGVYYTKSLPAQPVLLRRDQPGGFSGWVPGDVFTVDFAGMGCMLVDTSVFKDMTEPYFKYQEFEFEKNGLPLPTIGEDVWFCDKVAKEAKEKVWVDSSVLCGHENAASRTVFRHDDKLGRGVAQNEAGQVRYIKSTEEAAFAPKNIKKGKKVCWGYTDELATYEEAGTIKYSELRERYADIKRAKVKNVLEFQRRDAAVGFLNYLWSLMAEGAPVSVEVPNIALLAEKITGGAHGHRFINKMYGSDKNAFKSGYTKESLIKILSYAGFEDVRVAGKGEKLSATATKGKRNG